MGPLPLMVLGAALTAATYANPVFDEDFPDPTVIDAGRWVVLRLRHAG